MITNRNIPIHNCSTANKLICLMLDIVQEKFVSQIDDKEKIELILGFKVRIRHPHFRGKEAM
jgi:hypothetical protein